MRDQVAEAVQAIRDRVSIEAKIGIILGSGLGDLVNTMEDSVSVRFAEIPHFPNSTIEGHRGEVVAGCISGVPIFGFLGRLHYYEGYTIQQVVFPIEVMSGLGVNTLIITNASGAVNESYLPGDIVVIGDHINMMGENPLRGTPDFTDMTEAYSGDLRVLALETADTLDITAHEGVYLALSGPSYETPAEIRMLRGLGADLVGMSTVPEAIAANSKGVRVLGLSLVTNMAAGITGNPLSHEEVIEASKKAAEKFSRLVFGIIERLGNDSFNGKSSQ